MAKNESTLTPAVATARPTRIGMFLRNKPVSASILNDDFTEMADFIFNLPDDSFDLDGLVNFEKVLGDIEYLGRTTSIDEGLLKTSKVSSQKSSYARKWYQANRGKLAARRRKLKNSISAMAADKKRERLKKQKLNLNKKPLRQYNTKGHSNESFYDFVKPELEKKRPLPKREKTKYFMATENFLINGIPINKNQVFKLIGSKLMFEYENKTITIKAVPEMGQYLRRM